MYKFDKNKRYVTRAILRELHPLIQLKLWDMIDCQIAKKLKMDYLQVFTFSIEKGKLKIKLQQEQPSREITSFVEISKGCEFLISKKIYVIDDIDHSTMLYASEY